MRSALKTLAICLLIALMPVRAMAAVTIGFCASGHGDPLVAAHGGHGHDVGAHQHHGNDEPPAKSGASSCSSCVECCSGAALAPSADQAIGASITIAQDRISFASRVPPAFFSDQLDRPPLA
jgi:hypothetical protein